MIYEYFLKVFDFPIYFLMVSFNKQKFCILIMPSWQYFLLYFFLRCVYNNNNNNSNYAQIEKKLPSRSFVVQALYLYLWFILNYILCMVWGRD